MIFPKIYLFANEYKICFLSQFLQNPNNSKLKVLIIQFVELRNCEPSHSAVLAYSYTHWNYQGHLYLGKHIQVQGVYKNRPASREAT